MASCTGMKDAKKSVLAISDEEYPRLLSQIEEPPDYLRVLGDAKALQPGIAIVGARKATPYGLACAERFAKAAAQKGITVVSGGAMGCDSAAHRGALLAGGKTVVVFGSGADVAYPKRSKTLFDKVLAGGGAIVSELPWGTSPIRWAFARRNRIISGLSKAVLIVEAGLPSGTFSTADYATSQGREVLAVPGAIFSKESRGSNQLIYDGAIPIVDDNCFNSALDRIFGCNNLFGGLFGNLDMGTNGMSANGGSCSQIQYEGYSEGRLIKNLSASPMTPDEIALVEHKDILQIIKDLSVLEAKGCVVRYPDGRFGVDPKVVYPC